MLWRVGFGFRKKKGSLPTLGQWRDPDLERVAVEEGWVGVVIRVGVWGFGLG